MSPNAPHTLLLFGVVAIFSIGLFISIRFDRHFRTRIYPGVSVGGIAFGNKTQQDIITYWTNKNGPFRDATYTLQFDGTVATISGSSLDVGYDATLSATQAYLVGRSGYIFSDFFQKFMSRTDLSPYFRWNTSVLDDALESLAADIDIPVQDALFRFAGGRVTSFRPSRSGRKVNRVETTKRFEESLRGVATTLAPNVIVNLVVDSIDPSITTDRVNSFGITELLGRGYSIFSGSIPGRVHNIVLAASRINGVLVKPGDTFSFNDTVGDISAATGYQSAYIIKDGRTILGDGGGVCQVSTTLFRVALAAGLPVVERHAHAYRVHFYEDGGFRPGLDATVYAPNYDLKFKNDTQSYILVQAKPDTRKQTLTFELYGTSDGRVSQILNHKVWDMKPPPPDLYQDDPTLAPGVTKQVDWKASGAKASFDYIVRRNGEILTEKTFFSNFRPWQAVYLRGPQ